MLSRQMSMWLRGLYSYRSCTRRVRSRTICLPSIWSLSRTNQPTTDPPLLTSGSTVTLISGQMLLLSGSRSTSTFSGWIRRTPGLGLEMTGTTMQIRSPTGLFSTRARVSLWCRLQFLSLWWRSWSKRWKKWRTFGNKRKTRFMWPETAQTTPSGLLSTFWSRVTGWKSTRKITS